MKITAQQYAESLLSALESVKPSDHDRVIENFLKILSQNGDMALYEKVIKEFEILDKKKKGISEAEVIFSKEAENNSKILDELNRIVGKKVEMKQKIDENIIGGIVVKVDDTLIDASLKTQLKTLNQQLKH